LYEDSSFPARDLAALVASKVYYHLGDLDEALTFALGAGKLFNVADTSDQYVETILCALARLDSQRCILSSGDAAKCIDKYVEAQNADAPTSDARLKTIVERLFQRCIDDHEYKQALGIAIESRRLDVIERVFGLTNDADLLAYVLEAAITVVPKLDFRDTVRRRRTD
jgi:26S proteasome regulatory subunit N2